MTEGTFMLRHKTTVIYGAGGAIGGAVARAFARHGVSVFLAGRTVAKVDAVAKDFSAAGFVGGGGASRCVEGLKRHADMPGIEMRNNISVGGGAKTAWFKDTEGNILAVSQRL